MKQRIKLTEGQLGKIIRNSVKRIIKEGTTDSRDLERWDYAVEMNGADAILSELQCWLGSDDIHEFIEHLERYEFIPEEESYDDEEDVEL